MPNVFELDISTLQHLDYHWLWGLRYSKTPQIANMATVVEELLQDEEQLTRLKASQEVFYRASLALRIFYWLFNINNYTYHGYVLTLYQAHQNYLSHSQEEKPAMETTNSTNPFFRMLRTIFTSSLVTFFRRFAFSGPGVTSNALMLKPGTSAAQEIQPPLMNKHTHVETILVTEAMAQHLEILGIHLDSGATLNLSEFKSTCKKMLLASHPDKGGTDAKFIQIKEAIVHLQNIISPPIKPGASDLSENNNYWWDFSAELAEINVNLTEAFAAAAAANKELREATRGLREEIEETREAVGEMREAVGEMREVTREGSQVAGTIMSRCEDMNAELEVMQEQMNALIRSKEAAASSSSNVSVSSHSFFSSHSAEEAPSEHMLGTLTH